MTEKLLAVAGDQETLNDIPNHGDGTYSLVATDDDILEISGIAVVQVGQEYPAHCANASAASAGGGSALLEIDGKAAARIGDVSSHPVHTCQGIFGDHQDFVTVNE